MKAWVVHYTERGMAFSLAMPRKHWADSFAKITGGTIEEADIDDPEMVAVLQNESEQIAWAKRMGFE